MRSKRSKQQFNNHNNGDYIELGVKPKNGLKTARMLGHITYLSEENMDLRFGRKFQDSDSKVDGKVDFEVENYLQYKGEKFTENFDANSYILMTKAMDGYDASKNFKNLDEALSSVSSELLIVDLILIGYIHLKGVKRFSLQL